MPEVVRSVLWCLHPEAPKPKCTEDNASRQELASEQLTKTWALRLQTFCFELRLGMQADVESLREFGGQGFGM